MSDDGKVADLAAARQTKMADLKLGVVILEDVMRGAKLLLHTLDDDALSDADIACVFRTVSRALLLDGWDRIEIAECFEQQAAVHRAMAKHECSDHGG